MISKQSHTKDSQFLAAKKENLPNNNDLGGHKLSKNSDNVNNSGSLLKSKKKKWRWRKNKKAKKNPCQVGSESGNGVDKTSEHVTAKRKCDEVNDSIQPAKKKKKKLAKKGDSANSTSEYKPILIVKKAEDYSANWKQLKEVKYCIMSVG